LAYILGHDSILGKKLKQSFAAEVQAILRRITLLFDALDAPEVQRIDPAQRQYVSSQKIVPADVALFRQRRPFGRGYARAFLTPQHIEATGQKPATFWKDLETRCEAATPEQLLGIQHWAILHFRRGVIRIEPDVFENCEIEEIGFG